MPKNQVLSFVNNNSNIRVIVDSTNEVLLIDNLGKKAKMGELIHIAQRF